LTNTFIILNCIEHTQRCGYFLNVGQRLAISLRRGEQWHSGRTKTDSPDESAQPPAFYGTPGTATLLTRKNTGTYPPNFQIDLIQSALADPFPSDLPAEVRSEVTRLLLRLKEAGWTVEPIQWESASAIGNDKRVSFSAKSANGKRVHSSCPESRLPERLSVLLDSRQASTHLLGTCPSPIIHPVPKSRSDTLITMVKAAEFRDFDDRSMLHNRTLDRALLLERRCGRD
jgi:hypothetical protein